MPSRIAQSRKTVNKTLEEGQPCSLPNVNTLQNVPLIEIIHTPAQKIWINHTAGFINSLYKGL